MDDGTKAILDKLGAFEGRFDRVDQRLDALDGRFDLTNERWDRAALRVEQVHGLVQRLETKMEERFQAVVEHQRALFGELVRKFQAVITEAERIGAATATSSRMAEIEARVAKLEEILTGGGSKQ